MKKKILMLIMLVFLLCGCNAKVDIKIDKYTIDETITINDYANVDTTKDMVLAKYRKYIPVDGSIIIPDTQPDERMSGIKYYTRTYNDIGNGYSFVYKYNHNFKDYYKASSVKNGFKSSYINYDRVDNKIIVSTDNSGLTLFDQYKDLSSVKVNLSSDYEVITSNADYHNGDVYTWNLSRTNNKGIYIEYKTKDPVLVEEPEEEEEPIVEEEEEEEENEDDIPLGLALIIVLLAMFGFILIVLVVNKIDKRKYN